MANDFWKSLAILPGTIFLIVVCVLTVYLLFKIIPTKGRLERLNLPHQRKIALCGIAIALIFGIFIRWAAYYSHSTIEVMSIAFLFVVPFTMGALTSFLGDVDGNWGIKHYILVPWSSAALTLGACFLLAWEGIICIILFLPAFLFISSIGGLIGGISRRLVKRTRGLFCCGLILLPFIAYQLELRVPQSLQLRKIETDIHINTSPDVVWNEIKSVRLIEEKEQQFSWNHLIGFPRPLEATLHGSGIGSYRAAIFEGNIIFHETIFEWEPEHSIAFKIRANTEDIPPTTLDEHVLIGGPSFDVLEGRYTIEDLGQNQVILHLESTHKLQTTFNFYAGIWSDFLMRDIQENILKVIKHRAESRITLHPEHIT